MIVTSDNVTEAATLIVARSHQLMTVHPKHGYELRATYEAGSGGRGDLIWRRIDGLPLKGDWGQETTARRAPLYGGEASMIGDMYGSLRQGHPMRLARFYGPHLPTSADKIEAWKASDARLWATYGPAWESRDIAAMRAAVAAWHAESRDWFDDNPSRSLAHQCRRIRGESHPRPFGMKRPWGRVRTGYAEHVERERALLEGLVALRSLPGFRDGDARDNIPVKTWMGRRYAVPRAELLNPLAGRHLHPVNAKGEPMRRTSLLREQVTAIIPERKAA